MLQVPGGDGISIFARLGVLHLVFMEDTPQGVGQGWCAASLDLESQSPAPLQHGSLETSARARQHFVDIGNLEAFLPFLVPSMFSNVLSLSQDSFVPHDPFPT